MTKMPSGSFFPVRTSDKYIFYLLIKKYLFSQIQISVLFPTHLLLRTESFLLYCWRTSKIVIVYNDPTSVPGNICWKNPNKDNCLSAWLEQEQDDLQEDTHKILIYKQMKLTAFQRKKRQILHWVFPPIGWPETLARKLWKKKDSLQTGKISHIQIQLPFASCPRHWMCCCCAFTHQNILLRTLVNTRRYLTIHICLQLAPQSKQQKQHLSQTSEFSSKLHSHTICVKYSTTIPQYTK